MKNTTKRFSVYSIVNALYDENVLTNDFTWKTTKHGEVVTDNNTYRIMFCQRSHEVTEIKNNEFICNKEIAKRANQDILAHYALIQGEDDSSIIQLYGKINRGNNGEVIIEFRENLFNTLDCNNLVIFKDCKHETYKGKTLNRLCVVDNTKDALKIIKAFIARLEKKRGKDTKTDVTEIETTLENVK